MSVRFSALITVVILAGVAPSGDAATSPKEVARDVIEHPAGDPLAVWSDIHAGTHAMPTITIDNSIYPNDAGVRFRIDGEIDERVSSARPNGYDATGPQDDSVFHVYPGLELRHGMEMEAAWTDHSGRTRVSTHVVGVGVQANDPSVPGTAPLAPTSATQWSDVEPGKNRLPTITIDRPIYPDDHGVQLYVNGTRDDRVPQARPDGWDATGPLDDSRFHIYPSLELTPGDRVEARWNVPDGESLRSVYVVGEGPLTTPGTPAPTTAPPTTTTTTTTPPTTTSPPPTTTTSPTTTSSPSTTTAPPPTTTTPTPSTTAPPSSPGFPNAETTGLSDPSALRSSGSITVTTPGTTVENLDITGGITIDASDVTIRNVRVTNSGEKYLINILPGNSGISIEDAELDGQNVATHGIVHGGYTARRVNLHGVCDGFRVGSDTIIEDSWVHDLDHDGTWSNDPHCDAAQSLGGSNIQIRNNRLEGPWQEQTSALIMMAHLGGPLRDVTIENNLLSGGTYTLYLVSRDDNPPLGSDVVVRDNVWVRDSWKFGPLSRGEGSRGVTMHGNTFDDGTPL